MPSRQILHALDLLEEDDARNLAWGLLDESWTREQILDLLASRWPGSDPESCLTELLTAALVVPIPRTWPVRYRTRMAESVRLFTRLRQLFPGRPWQAGARLVSDYRFLHRARAFPRREIPASEALSSLRDREMPAAVLREVERVLGDRQLARFQVEATGAVLSALGAAADAGVVVSAGTGSGKTLAFYLPAMAALAASASHRAVAIYPRNELLKDQFATAVQEARRLRASGGRQLVVGAYFGPTPYNNRREPDPRAGWRRSGNGWLCPFLICPAETDEGTCGHPLRWRRPNSPGGDDDWGTLVCGTCGGRVTADEVALTRSAMQNRPPDILFTTTEMLNQSLSDGWSRHVFGAGRRSDRPPAMVLLDEIHTYSGTSGAQAAFLLRRWRKLLTHPVTWVGLSATLTNAGSFFADLCGIPAEDVTDVRPESNDMAQRGSEYQLLLRGDPASQAALLSTSIQSLMLLRRVLDETGAPLDGPYGTKVFAFLENLDLVNRLYRQLLNAEGRTPLGRLDPAGTVLAGLRIPAYAEGRVEVADPVAWEQDGQHWWLAERVGFGDRSLRISRTSSQDSGVDSGSDVVVATSSLEVGYDDPRVGAVLQHKAPRDIAQFLQRRGRAGRSQGQRPWTVVVLSDYGRDRLAFQDYETLLDPVVPAKTLPLGNQSVRKMQAALCLVDWMAERLGVDGPYKWSTRRALVEPPKQQEAEACLGLLREVLDGGGARDDLLAFVRSSLRLTKEETASLGWEHPRSLLLEVVPTAYRRLLSTWGTSRRGLFREKTDIRARQPLPEYVPATLFSDLELPEVEVAPPEGYDAAAETSLPVGMALAELAPGKVTLRWAVQKVRGLWIEPPPSGVLDLDDGLGPDGDVVTQVPGLDGIPVPLVRPRTIRPTIPPPSVRPTSNGRLRWRFLVDDARRAMPLNRPKQSPLGALFPALSAHLTVGSGSLTTWRYALDGVADLVLESGRDRRAVSFAKDGAPAAVGFESTVDALMVSVQVPALVGLDFGADPNRLDQLRSDRFRYVCRTGLEESGVGPFVAGWVADVALAVAARALLDGTALADVAREGTETWFRRAEGAVDGVLVSLPRNDEDEVPLRQTVLDVCTDGSCVAVQQAAMTVLEQQPDASWLPWLRSRFLQTAAAAVQDAAQHLCPDFNVDLDVTIDVLDDSAAPPRVVLCDVAPGGGGLVEALTRRISDDPRRFDQLVAAALEPSDVEEIDPALRRALSLLEDDSAVQAAAAAFRSSGTNRLSSWKALLATLRDEGVSLSHAVMANLSSRVFRPGSGPASDRLLRTLLRRWDDIDSRVGFAVDHRTACAVLAEDKEVLDLLSQVVSAAGTRSSHQAPSVLQSLLWVRACARRPESLRASNRFLLDAPLTERTLMRDCLPKPPADVDVDADEWPQTVASALQSWGQARLVSRTGNVHRLACAVRTLSVEPLETDWLLAHPELTGLTREEGRPVVTLSLREAPQ
jgi:hypothetical protein